MVSGYVAVVVSSDVIVEVSAVVVSGEVAVVVSSFVVVVKNSDVVDSVSTCSVVLLIDSVVVDICSSVVVVGATVIDVRTVVIVVVWLDVTTVVAGIKLHVAEVAGAQSLIATLNA